MGRLLRYRRNGEVRSRGSVEQKWSKRLCLAKSEPEDKPRAESMVTVSRAETIELEGSEHPEASIYSEKRSFIKTVRNGQRPGSRLRLTTTPLDQRLFHQCLPRWEMNE